MKLTRFILLASNSIRSLLFWFAVVVLTGTFSDILSSTFSAQALQDVPLQTKFFRLESDAFNGVLNAAPMERTGKLTDSRAVLTLPLPDGKLVGFQIEESPVMDSELAAQFPDVKSYRGQAVEEPAMTMRCDLSPRGFYALILNGSQTINVYPVDSKDSGAYASSFGGSIQDEKTQCLVEEVHNISLRDDGRSFAPNAATAPEVSVGSSLRTYRIAIAATWEYCSAYGSGTNAGTVASINTWLNGVNAVYERELAVHLNLVNNTNILYTTQRGFSATTDPFTNDDVVTMFNEVRPVLRDQVGQANYDLGHVLGLLEFMGASGISMIGVVCDNTNQNGLGPIKGGSSTQVGGAAGNSTALGVLVHEIGHLFGANHSFNGTVSNCSGSRKAVAAYESGSGETIMGYSGICDADNIANSRDMRFHAISYAEINSYLAGTNCSTNSSTGNNPPTVNAGPDFTIPKNTPFTLTAVGSDPNTNDVANLTYTWDQYDSGSTVYPQDGTSASYNDAADPSDTSRPIFRPFPATISPSRTFPKLTYILNNANNPPDIVSGLQTAEELPRIGRSLNFRVMIRDNRSGGGGVNEDSVLLTVAGNAGPFLVTAPETAVSWAGGTLQTVTWSVNGTNVAPVNCANVKISLSTDGGNTFPYILAASTPNDGSEGVAVPTGLNSTTARIKVEAVGNIFFDISGVNFPVTPGSVICTYSILPVSQNFSASGGGGSVTVTSSAGCAWTAASNAPWITVNSGATGSGNGSVAYTVAASTGTFRTGTMTIAGQLFTVTQDAFVCPVITVMPTNLDGFAGPGYTQMLSASGGTAAYTFTVTGGALPGGLSLSTAGVITGTPNVGTFSFAITATDANGCMGTRTYMVTISPSPSGLMFYPLTSPVRLLDTRGNGVSPNACTVNGGQPITGGTSLLQMARSTCTIPANAQAITGNVTTVTSGGGYLTLYPSGAAQPNVASTNYNPNEIVNNVFTVGLGADGKFNIYALNTTDVIVDVTGYYAPPATGGLYFHPLPAPVRLLETRVGQPVGCVKPGAPLGGGADSLQTATTACTGIPASARAIVGNATTVGPQVGGFLTLFPADAARPMIASSNYATNQIVNGPFTTGLSLSGQFKIFTLATTDLVVDVLGYYSAQAADANGAGLLFTPLAHPVRLLDTRNNPAFPGCFKPNAPLNGNQTYVQSARGVCGGVTIPASALGVVGNATVVAPLGGGYLILWPSTATQPTVATLNYNTGEIVNRHFIVGLGNTDGAFKMFSFATTDLVIDLSGYFAP